MNRVENPRAALHGSETGSGPGSHFNLYSY